MWHIHTERNGKNKKRIEKRRTKWWRLVHGCARACVQAIWFVPGCLFHQSTLRSSSAYTVSRYKTVLFREQQLHGMVRACCLLNLRLTTGLHRAVCARPHTHRGRYYRDWFLFISLEHLRCRAHGSHQSRCARAMIRSENRITSAAGREEKGKLAPSQVELRLRRRWWRWWLKKDHVSGRTWAREKNLIKINKR